MTTRRESLFWVLLLSVPVLVVAVVLTWGWRYLDTTLQPAVVAYLATHLSEADRQGIRQQLQQDAGGFFQEIPDPLAGRVAVPGYHGLYKGVEVRINNAGFRSDSDFGPKPAGVYRIICLGDSFVFGTGVPVTQRFCDRLQQFYREQGITVNGKAIETLALGLPSYTLRQEVAYLSARFSVYAPDVVVVVSVQNDITDNSGVTSTGVPTTEFSLERRANGSAVYSNQMGLAFGQPYYTALTTDLSPQARWRWEQAFTAVHGLQQQVAASAGHLLLTALQMPARHNRLFFELYKEQAHALGVPVATIDYWQGKKTRLPDDGHPNAFGHELLMAHYVHLLADLGWVPVPEAQRPMPVGFVPSLLNPPVDAAVLQREREQFVREHIADQLDFRALPEEACGALLGGIFPEQAGGVAATPVWASVEAAFLLQAPVHPRDQLQLAFMLPDQAAAFPFALEVSLDGVVVGQRAWTVADVGQTVSWSLPVARGGAISEVVLRAASHTEDLTDHRMKTVRLLSAAIRSE